MFTSKYLKIFLFTFILLATAISSKASLTDNMTAYYSFDDYNTTLVTNLVSGGVNGTATTPYPSITSGKINFNRYSDGTGNYNISLSNSVCNFDTGNFSVSGWFKYDSAKAGTSPNSIIGNQHGTGNAEGWQIYIPAEGSANNRKLIVQLVNNSAPSSSVSLVSTSAYLDSNYHHFVIERSSANLSMYVDGSFITSSIVTPSLSVNYGGTTCKIFNNGQQGSGFKGYIDELALFSRFINETEIAQLHNSGFGYNPIMNYSNLFNVTFSDEGNQGIISSSIVLQIFSNNSFQQYNLTNGSLFTLGLSNGEYYLLYSSLPTYVERTYYLTINGSTQVSNILPLYLINITTATVIDVSVKDSRDLSGLNGATVVFERFFAGSNSWRIVDECRTVNSGTCNVNGVINDVYYKVLIYYNGEVLLTTDPFRLTTSSLSFILNTGTNFLNFYNGIQSILYNLTYVTSSGGYFKYEYVDTNGIVSRECMNVYDRRYIGDFLLCSTCDTASAGTLLCAVNSTNGTNMHADVFVYDSSNNQYFIATLQKIYETNSETFGILGVFFTAILFIVFVFLSLKDPSMTILYGVLSIIVSMITGLVYVTFGGLVMIIIGAIFILTTKEKVQG